MYNNIIDLVNIWYEIVRTCTLIGDAREVLVLVLQWFEIGREV